MRISSRFSLPGFSAAILVLTLGECAAQTRDFSGTWRLNVEKSTWHSVAKPVNVVIVIQHRDPHLEYEGAVTYANEDTREFAFAGALDGKPYPMARSFAAGSTTLRRIDDATFESSFRSDDGLSTETARTTLSRDGKRLTRKLTARSPDGVNSWIEVYDKL